MIQELGSLLSAFMMAMVLLVLGTILLREISFLKLPDFLKQHLKRHERTEDGIILNGRG